MKRIITFTLALLFSVQLHAQVDPPSNINNEDLRVWLKSNWYDSYFTDLGYSGARIQMYGFVDEDNGEIECIYTGFRQEAEFVTFPDPINAEHIIPQSFFGGQTPMRSDIFNMRPSHGSANSSRSNYPYNEVNDNQSTWFGINGFGDYFSTNTEPGNSDDFSEKNNFEWEPREEYKGDIARQIFYFYTMYPTQAGPITDVADLNIIYQWHLNDPVSAEELQRNARIETAQGNRNPYVLFEDLVYRAWFFEVQPGCTDPAADNYDSSANMDDGSCTYSSEGCTYPQAINYDALATVDDGSCEFVQYIQGCTYATASNYDPTANFDDGSCLFELSNSCPTDINGDGTRNVSDVLAVLAVYGTDCE